MKTFFSVDSLNRGWWYCKQVNLGLVHWAVVHWIDKKGNCNHADSIVILNTPNESDDVSD